MKPKPLQQPRVTCLALACVCALGVSTAVQAQHEPIGTNEIAFADFDNFVPGWDYGYFYSDGSIGGEYTRDRAFYDPPDYTNIVFRYTFDSTVFAGFTSWWGTGFGMPVPWGYDPAVFNSVDPADYILSLDARVEGLAEGETTANCTMEFRLGVSGTWAIVKALPYNPGSNWTHFVFTLDQGSYISADGQPTTSYSTFTNGILTGITAVQFNQNHPNPSQFGFDADNAIYLDNVKLEVLQYAGPPPPPPPKQAVTIFDYNFDDRALWYAWGEFPGGTGWSANANRASYWVINNAAGAGVEGSQAYIMAMDNSLIATDPPGLPQWAGGNTGGGGPVNYTPVSSPEMKDYQIRFDARVEGLAEGQENTPVTVQLYFRAPDDTIEPPDADTEADVLLRHNIEVSGISSNWVTFTKSLKDGAVNAGSLANFKTYLSKINGIDFQLQILNSQNTTLWGADADNQIVIDNFRLERLVTGTPPLTVQSFGDKVVVFWAMPDTGSVKLLKGSSITAVDTEVVGATSPYTNAVSAGPLYFRTLWVPPTP